MQNFNPKASFVPVIPFADANVEDLDWALGLGVCPSNLSDIFTAPPRRGILQQLFISHGSDDQTQQHIGHKHGSDEYVLVVLLHKPCTKFQCLPPLLAFPYCLTL